MDPREPNPGGGQREPDDGQREPVGGEPNGTAEDGHGTADEALRRLEQRLDRASDAAERLLAEAAGSAARAARAATGVNPAPETPPAGWQIPAPDAEQSSRSENELLMQVLMSLRDLIPPELQRRLTEALRELLLAIRAVIDWYLERADRARAAPAEVQDIPIA